MADAHAANPKPPTSDVEALRPFYEQAYYSTLYVKTVDPNHLYFGSWILAGDSN